MRRCLPYLIFPGSCRAALEFYAGVLGGDIESLQTFAESPIAVPEDQNQRIFNSIFRAQGIAFMASDDLPQYPTTRGSNFSLIVFFADAGDQRSAYRGLLQGGTASMPLPEDAAGFGMLTDKFGVQWMLAFDPGSTDSTAS